MINDREMLLQRIEINPKVMVGKPVIKGTRLTVQLILDLLAQGMSQKEIMEDYPGLKAGDIAACLVFASKALDSTFAPLSADA
jgi:uncharacterized protein (DUF433 family)